jgi:plasminogen activator inhibitor 1 RNA-binding protein
MRCIGNDPELDPDREPEPPTKAIDKPVPRSGKRDIGPKAPAEPSSRRGGRGGSRGTETGNERGMPSQIVRA